ALRHRPLERCAGDAGGDHAAAALVSVSPGQGLLLGAHGSRAPHGALCAAADGQEPTADQCAGTLLHTPREDRPLVQGSAPALSLEPGVRWYRSLLENGPAPFSGRVPEARDRRGRAVYG